MPPFITFPMPVHIIPTFAPVIHFFYLCLGMQIYKDKTRSPLTCERRVHSCYSLLIHRTTFFLILLKFVLIDFFLPLSMLKNIPQDPKDAQEIFFRFLLFPFL